MRKIIFLLQLILVIIQIITYIISEIGVISFLIVNISAFTVIISFSLSWGLRGNTNLKGKGFSIILFFILMSWIVSFQVPLEIVYGNYELLDPSSRLIYDASIINRLVAFSSLMLNFFLVGVSYSYIKYKDILTKSKVSYLFYRIPSYPLFILIFICFMLFLLTLNSGYVDNGHGSTELDSTSASAIGLLIRFSVLYLSLKIFKIKEKNLNLIKYMYSINIYYISFLIIAVIFFLLAGNRFYPIMVFTPFLFSLFIYYKKNIRLPTVLGFFLLLSVFGTLFKLYGISDIYKSGLKVDDGYIISKFYFIFTAELAGSIYSNTVLYSMWENSNFSLYGMSYLVGILRTVPGVMSFLNISPIFYDTAVIATIYSDTSYGVGTTAIVDMLINFGTAMSLIFFLVLGYFFGRAELKVYDYNVSIYSYIIYLGITVLLLFYPRASLNDLLGILLFSLIFFKLYTIFFKRGFH